MEKNPIDDLFRARLADRETVPPAFVWDAVEKAIAQKKRRRWAVAAWAVGALALAGGGAAFWFLKAEKTVTENGFSAPVAVIEKAEKGSLDPFSNAAEKGKTDAPAGLFEVQKAAKKEAGKASKVTVFSAENGAIEKGFLSKKMPVVLTEKGEQKGSASPFSLATANNELTEKFQQKAVSEPFEIAAEKAAFEPAFIKKEKLFFEPLLAADRPSKFEKTSVRDLPKMKAARARKRTRNCPTFSARGSAFLIEAWAGPSFVLKELKPVPADAPNYANRRAATEQVELSANAGVRAAYLFHRKFMVRGGLQYTQINELFDWKDPDHAQYTIHGNTQQGNIDTIWHYGQWVKKTNNRLRFLDLPVTIGAELVGGQFGLSLHGGAAMNLVFAQRGEVLMPDGQPERFSKSKIFRSNAGLSLLGSAQVFYQLDSKTRLFAEPYFQKILRPVTRSGNEVEQRYATSGVQIGLTRLLK